MKRMLLMALALCVLTGAALAETLILSDQSTSYPEQQTFLEAHPDVTLRAEGKTYRAHNDLVYDLINGTVASDVLDTLYSHAIDLRAVMEKGYLADLSGSDYLMEQVARMYRPIQEYVMRDGRLYAIPDVIMVELFVYDRDGWEAAGYTEADVPDSFPALLHFLDAWCDRIEREPVEGVRAFGMFEAAAYDEASYTRWLAEALVDQQVLKCQYAGEPVRFDGAFVALLERVRAVGRRLYEVEPWRFSAARAGSGLSGHQLFGGFQSLFGAEDLARSISLRLSEDDLPVTRGVIGFSAVSAASEHQELAVAYLEERMRGLSGESQRPRRMTQTLFDRMEQRRAEGQRMFRDTQPVESTSGREAYERFRGEYEALEARLTSGELTGEERIEAENRRDLLREGVEHPSEAQLWQLSPEEAAWWQAHGDTIYYPEPGPFSLDAGSYGNVRSLVDQFAYGRLTAEQLSGQLDRLARMLEQERQ